MRLRRLAAENRYTVIVVTHELGLAAEFADQIVLLHRGKCLRVGPPAEVYPARIARTGFRGAARESKSAPRDARGSPFKAERRSSTATRTLVSASARATAVSNVAQPGCADPSTHRELRVREDGRGKAVAAARL